MSGVSGVGRQHHRNPLAARPSQGSSLTAKTLSGSITASTQALSALGGNAGLSSDLMKQIEQAVTSALQSSKPTDDPHKVVQNAILTVLKKNGANSPQGTDDGADSTDSDGTHRTFNQTLQAYGISPQQFRAQLLAAVHKSGAASTSNLSSFPPGVVLDTSASRFLIQFTKQ